MFQRLRLNHGLRWREKRPPILRPLFALIVLLLLFTLASTLDYYYAKAQELERLLPVHKSYSNVVVGVMNGDVKMAVGDLMFECKGGKL